MHPSIVNTSIIDLLEADPRPSLIVALDPHLPTVVYTNPACSNYATLVDLITARSEECKPLWEWIITGGSTSSSGLDVAAKGGRSARSSFVYSRVLWTRSVVHEQMVVVGANEQISPPEPPRKVRLDVAEAQHSGVGNGSPPRRIMPVETDKATATAATENQAPSRPLPEDDRRVEAPAAALLPAETKERPPPGADAVESLGQAEHDPRWIVPDITPGRKSPPSLGWPITFHSRAAADLAQYRATPIP
jgi:hypothetical protein